ncbi:MAG: hypothetical protein Q8S73_06110 [Deltaproteobacteria bacterium]|nr:hypothetical protein [Myxococcales bacterium]MDP3213657.1 hypothetical protein [Deltaproteobacteria bacterium]
MRWAGVAAGWATAALVGGCERPRTQLVLGVDTELTWGVGAELQSVSLEVRRGGGSGPLRSHRTTALGSGNGRRALPLWVTVVSADDDDTSPVWIEALGCPTPDGCTRETAVVAQRASVRFVTGETGLVRLMLASACGSRRCALTERCATATGECIGIDAQGDVGRYGGMLPGRWADGSVAGDSTIADVGEGDALAVDTAPDLGVIADVAALKDSGVADAGDESVADVPRADAMECTPGGSDQPDLAFEDTDCDGIDGEVVGGVFVSPRGDDSNDGAMPRPLRTLAAAVAAAARATPRRVVFAAVGTYAEPLELRDPVSIFGGYDDRRSWARTRDAATVIEPGAVGVMIHGVSAGLELQLLTVQSAAATTPGATSYGVRVVGSSARVLLSGCAITCGDGGSGSTGMAGATGEPGGVGGTAGRPTAGAAGLSMCGGGGGAGGIGVSGSNDGNSGAAGQNNRLGFGAGGVAGRQGGGCCADAGLVAQPGVAGTAGSVGTSGDNGIAAAMFGAVVAEDGTYVPTTATAGTDGSGGGGGGCGGAGGAGGASGGGSIAVLSVGSTVRVEGCRLTTGRGGVGGAGGAGGAGGGGGNGGAGSGGSRTAGTGGAGGAGGAGGGGGGGAGGPSVCVYSMGPAVMVSATTCARGGGGPGSPGGRGAADDAPMGPPGVSEDIRTATP